MLLFRIIIESCKLVFQFNLFLFYLWLSPLLLYSFSCLLFRISNPIRWSFNIRVHKLRPLRNLFFTYLSLSFDHFGWVHETWMVLFQMNRRFSILLMWKYLSSRNQFQIRHIFSLNKHFWFQVESSRVTYTYELSILI